MIECTTATVCYGDKWMMETAPGTKEDGTPYEPMKVPIPAQFDGNENDAELAGWEEAEFGWVCPKCMEDDISDEESTGNALMSSDGDDLQKLMVAAAAHSNVDRQELAKQALERGVVFVSKDSDFSNHLDYEAMLGYINGLAEGHRAPVKEIVLGMVEAMDKSKLNNGDLLSGTIDNYDEAVQALK